jgi:hypothetical protein
MHTHTYTCTYIQCIHIYISICFLIFANSLLFWSFCTWLILVIYNLNFSLNGKKLEIVNSLNYLGIELSRTGTFKRAKQSIAWKKENFPVDVHHCYMKKILTYNHYKKYKILYHYKYLQLYYTYYHSCYLRVTCTKDHNTFIDIYEQLFNIIFETGIVPDNWLMGNIKPIKIQKQR